ncbi:hypothetical protein GcC1_190027 [Golovinomyces cichoracearum]|uniref:Uncharacterized protein n=1 Tax=Golovinomyces cichoracearum TaxID=62708 RepID=A0A420HIR4_9PEZI|nr:hypothetical protein GcC1_190027 [Golovinomyces cichoracearum]
MTDSLTASVYGSFLGCAKSDQIRTYQIQYINLLITQNATLADMAIIDISRLMTEAVVPSAQATTSPCDKSHVIL